jgi:hypothetical protein
MLRHAARPGLQTLLTDHEFDGCLLFDFWGRNPIAKALGIYPADLEGCVPADGLPQ